ncbi:MAG: PEP-CTERM sorting domain-containing protein, partial [Planctomycetota bacterium]|nr:PEP-CTERM sorting domain-containing protein [Planctomycetota bacterium]
ASTLDNTENIWFNLLDGHSYRLDVVRGSGQGNFLWDYGLGWQMVPEPDSAFLFLAGVAVPMLLRRRRRR